MDKNMGVGTTRIELILVAYKATVLTIELCSNTYHA